MEELRRVFISLEVPDGIKQKVADLVGFIGDMYPHPTENFHITLKFIGEVNEEQIQLLESLQEFLAANVPPLQIEFLELKVVESRLRLVAKNSSKIQQLFETIVSNISKIDLHVEDKIAFEPHITLGKVRADSEPPLLLYDFSQLNFTATTLVLYETTKGEKAAIYMPLKKVTLVGN